LNLERETHKKTMCFADYCQVEIGLPILGNGTASKNKKQLLKKE